MKNKILILAVSAFMGTVLLISCSTPEQKVKNAQDNVTQASNNLDSANTKPLTS